MGLFFGAADYASRGRAKPMAITWSLRRTMSVEVYQASTLAVA